ncbi:MAG: hypothetical protein SWH68_04190 [Thermodesulfobacteriota bacterium]|nr:hypothetical protein [Thermodesulfobacteriota bacterium]
MVHFFLFVGFFYNTRHTLGHDYGIILPQLLDGYFWFRNNGLDDVFWFSPAFCGGVPAFPHPIHFYYCVPQFLTFIMSPLNAVVFTFFIFAAIGFWGYYFLLLRISSAGVMLSFFGGVLFLFNGFYVYRMAIGHLNYHAFMLVPWCALLFLIPTPSGSRKARFFGIYAIVMAGCFLGYMIYSGLQTVLPPVFLSVLLLCLTAGLFLGDRFDFRSFALRVAGAVMVMLGLAAAKLSGVFHFLQQVPRTYYPLPQFPDLTDLLMVLVKSLFFFPAWQQARTSMVNMQLNLNRHEFEFGVTAVPLLLMGAGLIYLLFGFLRKRTGPSKKGGALFAMVLVLCLLPIALNFYSPGWSRLLKQIPLLASSTQCTRWFCMYIPFVILLTIMAVQRVPWLKRFQVIVAVLGMGCVVGWNGWVDKTYYMEQLYSPTWVVLAYEEVRDGKREPAITDISVCMDKDGKMGGPVYRNDAIVMGYSQLFCYDSMFGYGLEGFPLKTLEPGSVFKTTNGRLNLKNPACYVFPGANNCEPGAHFTIDEADAATAFTRYRSFPFEISKLQKGANLLTLSTLIAVCGVVLFYWTWRTVAFGRRRIVSREGAQAGCS